MRYRDRNPGALDGFLIGLAVGVAAGHLAPDDPYLLPELRWVLLLPAAGWGTLGGTLVRAPVTYRLNDEVSKSPATALER